ncbi:MAG: GDSL-type esterase/lipase family protein [Verrucomicrobiales bacterium]
MKKLLFLLLVLGSLLRADTRLLCLGDSITEGAGHFSVYRPLLAEKLAKAGYDITFIGPKKDRSGLAHAGYSGQNAGQIARHLAAYQADPPADLFLVHTGHNYFAKDQPVPQIIAATREIIKTARQQNPRAIILLAQVIPAGKLPKYSYLPELNKALAGLARELHRPRQPLILVDHASDFDWRHDTIADKVHPNARGAEKMAETWFQALRPLLPAP